MPAPRKYTEKTRAANVTHVSVPLPVYELLAAKAKAEGVAMGRLIGRLLIDCA